MSARKLDACLFKQGEDGISQLVEIGIAVNGDITIALGIPPELPFLELETEFRPHSLNEFSFYRVFFHDWKYRLSQLFGKPFMWIAS